VRTEAQGSVRRNLAAYAPAALWAAAIVLLAGASDLPEGPAVPHLDKLAHFGAYTVLGLLLGFGWLAAGRWPGRGWLLAFALTLGASDELRQARLPHRSAEFTDWLADAAGSATGLLVAVRLGRRRYGRRDNGERQR
jgi:VanZ family protein